MINRELIRLKVLQIAYAYYVNGGNEPDKAVKELFFSLSKAYELYHYLLLLLLEINKVAELRVETEVSRFNRLKMGEPPSMKFVNNLFIRQLEVNRQLELYNKERKMSWVDDEKFVRSLYDEVIKSDFYEAYMALPETTYEADREIWRKIYKSLICDNEALDDLLEDKCLYWNDDKFIVDTFVLKTIKRFRQETGAEQELLPEFESEEDRVFASELLHNSLDNAEFYRKLISDNTKNWEFNRINVMDLVIMQTALAEIMTFANIPVSVSLNEYVELAKVYSTPKSGSYVNGLLNTIAKKLEGENLIIKNENI